MSLSFLFFTKMNVKDKLIGNIFQILVGESRFFSPCHR